MHIIFESLLMLFTTKLSKLVHACRKYSLPQLARFLRHIVDSMLCKTPPFRKALRKIPVRSFAFRKVPFCRCNLSATTA